MQSEAPSFDEKRTILGVVSHPSLLLTWVLEIRGLLHGLEGVPVD